MRIVSLLPSATEIIWNLGLWDNLFGVTQNCDWPPDAINKPTVVNSVIDPGNMASSEIDDLVKQHVFDGSSIYQIDGSVLGDAKPDLIFTQGLCEVCAVSTDMVYEFIDHMPDKPQVVSLDPHSLNDVFNDILHIGEVTNRVIESKRLVNNLKMRRDRIEALTADLERKPSVLCLEWLDPVYIGGHWIPEMVEIAGGLGCFGEVGKASFGVSWEQVEKVCPEITIAMPCGMNTTRGVAEVENLARKKGWEFLKSVFNGKLFVVDSGSYFSRPGPRLMAGLEIMAGIMHPEIFAGDMAHGQPATIFNRSR